MNEKLAINKKINFLVNLRGVAVLCVVLTHIYSHIYGTNHFIDEIFFATQVAGLSFFFLITGFVIPISLEKINFKSFIVQRFFRLFPVLLIALLLKSIVDFNLAHFLPSFLLFFDIINSKTSLPQLWTLVIEIKFYLIYATIYYVLSKKITFINISKIYFLVLFFLYTVSVFIGVKYLISMFSRNIFILSYIFIGVSIKDIYFNKVKKEYVLHIVQSIALFIIFAFCLTPDGFQIFNIDTKYQIYERFVTYNFTKKYVIYSLISLIFFIAYMFLVKKNNKFLSFFANISYPVYLIHMIGLTEFASYFKYLCMPNILSFIVYLTIVIIVSAVITKYIEKPFIIYSKKLTSKKI